MFTPSPATTQSDPMQELLGKVLGGYKPGQLGAAPTLGNEQGQQDYARQLAEALAQLQSAKSGLGMADRLSQAEYAPNSGALGALSMMAQAYAGKKMRGRELAAQSDAMAKAYSAQEGVDERKAERDAARSEAVSNRERTRREAVARKLELNNREAVEFIETGKVPEAKRGEFVGTTNGIMYGDPYTGELGDVNQSGQRQPQPPPNVHIDTNMSPEDRAIALADATNNPTDPHGETVDYGTIQRQGQSPQQGRIMPYEKPQAPKFQSRQFTPAEVARMGLPAGTVAYSTEDGSPKIVNKPNAIPGGQTQVIDNGDGTQTVIPAGKTTEDQNKAAGWYASSTNALKNLRAVLAKDPSAIYPGVIETYAPNAEIKQRSMSPTRQQAAHAFDTMKMDFLHAATGAGFTKEEAADEWRNLSPQRGDDAPLVDQKLRQIEVKLNAMHQRAGGAAPQTAPKTAPQAQPAAPSAGHILKYNPKTGGFE